MFANSGITSSVVESLHFVAGKKVDHQTDVPKAPYKGSTKNRGLISSSHKKSQVKSKRKDMNVVHMYAQAAWVHIPKVPKWSNSNSKWKSSSVEKKPKSHFKKK